MASLPQQSVLERQNLKVGLYAFLGALFMLGMGYAAVPLYDLFCRVTGFGGTTQRATDAEADAAAARAANAPPISVRFDASTARDIPWTFQPEATTATVKIGQRALAFYTARNDSSIPITGVASFNVEPEQAGVYFNKIQCFCFSEQTLQPGEELRMPVLYFVDPAALDDPNMRGVEQITLSYTFHRKLEDQAD
jgi:cytochrome c oxidase assembly protein subunit 11